MKNSNEMALFLALSINSAFLSTQPDKTLVERISDYVPPIMNASAAFDDSALIGTEVKSAVGYDQLSEPGKVAYDAMAAVNDPERAIIAQQISVLVLSVGATGVFNKKEDESEDEEGPNEPAA